ncbi:MAG TPA: CoA transferase [Gemmatimonadaceae bacterium]|jgi:crotonobetainyl-CoA:carnitine CoA-transferase CaiB-like acyl-CoA transferase|nr:CoA transferase [Gemmatimonadaceae bacterium]
MLSGVRVLDLSRVLAGPLCTMMLGDLGADVLKVERPEAGDETRGWGPPFDSSGESAYFLSVNRNKLSVTADLGDPDDLALIRTLAENSDVVVENFLPGTLERRGWGADACGAARPEVVWCTISGFGLSSRRPGYDLIMQAESGWMSITGEPDGEPMKHGVALVDVLVGKDAVAAILAALVARGRTGVGRRVDVSLERSAEAALINVAQNAMVSGRSPTRWGNAHANLVPYQLFHALDRPFVIAVGNDGQWQACARALELHELAADATLSTNAGRLARRAEVVGAMSARLLTRRADEWRGLLDGAGVPCGIVRTVPEVLAGGGGSSRTGLPPSVPGTVRMPPPRLGEHSELVRAEGWGAFATQARVHV